MSISYNSIEVDLGALQDNFSFLRQRVQKTKTQILAMVKSDAYGHGLLESAQALADAGARYFGVAEVDEGVRLREAGIAGEIIVLLGSRLYDLLCEYTLSPVVFNEDDLAALSQAAVQKNQKIGVHVKVDVGMGRLGILPGQLPQFLERLQQLPGIFLAGVMGHFPCADECEKKDLTLEQLQRFSELITREWSIDSSNRTFPLLHIANSAAILSYPESFFHLVRPGISLYGYDPCGSQKKAASLRPVMRFKTTVLQVKNVPAGSGISYGHRYVTQRPTTLAVLPVGYADGYLRSLSGKAEVLIHGKRVPVRGRICMNACLADVTEVDAVRPGDEVVMMGCQADESGQLECITADEIAAWMGTISYEVLCLFGSSNERVFLKHSA